MCKIGYLPFFTVLFSLPPYCHFLPPMLCFTGVGYKVSTGDSVVVNGMQVQFVASSVRSGVKDPVEIEGWISFSPTSSGVSGSGLWRLAMYGSQNGDGTGPQFQPVYQTLTGDEQNLPQDSGRIEFVNALGQIDISAIGCGEYRFLCFDFTKGDNPSAEFTFTSLQGADSRKFTLCSMLSCSEPGGLFTFRIYSY